MYEKCEFLGMGYISVLTQASVLISSKNVCLLFKVIAKDTSNISWGCMVFTLVVLFSHAWFGRGSSFGEEFA